MLIFVAEILHTGRAAIDMKHIKRDFSLTAWVSACWVDLGGGSEVKIKFFSEYGHVAYQIKADDAGKNMVANILPTDAPSTQGVASKGQTIFIYFLKVAMLHIKLKLTTLVANILPTDTPWIQGVGSKVKLYLFLKVVMLHIKLKGFEHRAP